MANRVRLDIAERVALLTLADADRRNAIDIAFAGEIAAAIDSLEARDDVGAIVVTGEPPAFCAGANLSDLASPTPADVQAIYQAFLRIAWTRLPTVAAVNGPAVGAGMNLALACDIRIAAESARFESRFSKLGVHPGGGHTWLLLRAVGPQVARAMVLFGEPIGGRDAARLGLAWQAVPDHDLLATAHELARRAAAGDRELVARIKTTFDDMAAIDVHADAVERELEPQMWSFGRPEFVEQLAAARASITNRAATAASTSACDIVGR